MRDSFVVLVGWLQVVATERLALCVRKLTTFAQSVPVVMPDTEASVSGLATVAVPVNWTPLTPSRGVVWSTPE